MRRPVFLLGFVLCIALALAPIAGLTGAPAARADISGVTVSVTPTTPGVAAGYTITFTPTASNASVIFVNNISLGNAYGTPSPNGYYFAVTSGGYPVSVTQVAPVFHTGSGTVPSVMDLQISVSSGVAANQPCTVTISSGMGLLNPPAGNYSVRVSTMSEGTFVTSNVYTIGNASISNTGVSVSPQTSNTAAAWNFTFMTSSTGALTALSDYIQIEFPAGATLPTDLTYGKYQYMTVQNTALTSGIYVYAYGTTLRLYVPVAVYGSSLVSVQLGVLAGIRTPSTGGQQVVRLSTSKDLTPVSASFTLATSSVTGVQASVQPASVGAAAAYNVSFTTSSTGALAANADQIFLQFPNGTTSSAVRASAIALNNTPVTAASWDAVNVRLTLTVPVQIAASSSVSLVIGATAGIKNTPTTGSAYYLQVWTSSDSMQANSNTFSITPSTVGSGTVTVTPASAGVQAGYIVSFAPGSSGALGGSDSISVAFPSGFSFPSSVATALVSVNGIHPVSVAMGSNGRTLILTMTSGFVLNGGQSASVIIDKSAGIKNPAAPGNYKLSISTSKETTPVDTAAFAIYGAPTSTLTLNPVNPDGQNGWYVSRPTFTLSATNPSGGTVTLYYRLGAGGQLTTYTAPVALNDGQNLITYYSQDSAGNKEAEKSQTVNVDTVSPELTVISPTSGSTVVASSLTILGTVRGQSTLTVNGSAVTPAADGSFTTTASLSREGTNTFTVIASDQAGNSVTRAVTVNYINRVTMLLQVGNATAYVNNAQQNLDAAPFVKNGRVMIPLRFVSENFKATPNWDSIFGIVTLNVSGKTIRVQVGSSVADVNGKSVKLDVPPVLIKGRVYVPIRFISENFGASVVWDATMKIVTIVFPKP